MKKLLPDGRSYQNRLPETVKGDAPSPVVSKLDYNSWHRSGQRGGLQRSAVCCILLLDARL